MPLMFLNLPLQHNLPLPILAIPALHPIESRFPGLRGAGEGLAEGVTAAVAGCAVQLGWGVFVFFVGVSRRVETDGGLGFCYVG